MEIDIKKIEKRKVPKGKLKNIKVSIRVDQDVSKFLKEKNISPTGLFYEALKVVGYK